LESRRRAIRLRHHDCIIVHPLGRDKLTGFEGRGVVLVGEAGQWRLYRVQKVF